MAVKRLPVQVGLTYMHVLRTAVRKGELTMPDNYRSTDRMLPKFCATRFRYLASPTLIMLTCAPSSMNAHCQKCLPSNKTGKQ